eukprot:Hpha_TRINITY_DN3128_c0_g1::TRINITY_DN3128_c0_g1_i1::g.96526::m.96526
MVMQTTDTDGSACDTDTVSFFQKVNAPKVFDSMAEVLLRRRPDTETQLLLYLQEEVARMLVAMPGKAEPMPGKAEPSLALPRDEEPPDVPAETPTSEVRGKHANAVLQNAEKLFDELLSTMNEGSAVAEWIAIPVERCDKTLVKHASMAQSQMLKPTSTKDSAPAGETTKFGDGIDNLPCSDYAPDVAYLPPEFSPTLGISDTFLDIANWSHPDKKLWEAGIIDRMAQDSEMISARFGSGKGTLSQSALKVRPIFYYTADLHVDAVWAFWNPSQRPPVWQKLPRDAILELEKAINPAFGEAPHPREIYTGEIVVSPTVLAAFGGALARRSRVIGTEKDRKIWMRHESSLPFGLSLYMVDPVEDAPPLHVVRYVNKLGGRPDLSPLHDTVMWLPAVQNVMGQGKYEYNTKGSKLPPPGVWEMISARGADEEFDWEGTDWSVVPLKSDATELLMTDCLKATNQKKFDEHLHKELLVLLNSSAPVIRGIPQLVFRKLVIAKCPEEPSPEAIAHALQLQGFTWKGTHYAVGLTGLPRLVVDTQSGSMIKLFRAGTSHRNQIFYQMNNAMRLLQSMESAKALVHISPDEEELFSICGGHDSVITTMAGQQRELRYLEAKHGGLAPQGVTFKDWLKQDDRFKVGNTFVELRDPVDVPPMSIVAGTYIAEGDPHTKLHQPFVRPDHPQHKLWFRHGRWEVECDEGVMVKDAPALVTAEADSVEFSPGVWMLHQMRNAIYHLDRALKDLPTSRTKQKTYRGLVGVNLSPDVYALHSVVLWCAYSSSSIDQGVACSFASAGGAAIFTINGESPRQIFHYSRFAREQEWLYLPNSRFQVTSVLNSDMQEILGKEDLQMFSLTEVTNLKAQTLAVRALLKEATTLAQCSVIFTVIAAIESETGDVGLGIKEDRQAVDGQAGWEVSVKILYDAFGNCPAVTNAVTDNGVDAADRLSNTLHRRARDPSTAKCPKCLSSKVERKLRCMDKNVADWTCSRAVLYDPSSSEDEDEETDEDFGVCPLDLDNADKTRGLLRFRCFACEYDICEQCNDELLCSQAERWTLDTEVPDGDDTTGTSVDFSVIRDEAGVIQEKKMSVAFAGDEPKEVRRVQFVMDGARPQLFFPDLVGTDAAYSHVLLPLADLPFLRRLFEHCKIVHNLPSRLLDVSAEDAAMVLSAPANLAPNVCYCEPPEIGAPLQTFSFYAIRHPPLPKLFAPVTRNPLCWSQWMGDHDGGEGSVGRVEGIQGVWSETLSVRWPVAQEAQEYPWGGFSRDNEPGYFPVQPVEDISAWAVRARLCKMVPSGGLRMAPAGGKLIMKILMLGVKITRLVLRGHFLGEKGAGYIMEGLRHNPHVTEVLFSRDPVPPISTDLIKMIQFRCAAHQNDIPMALLVKSKRWDSVAASAVYDLPNFTCFPFEDFVLRHGPRCRSLLNNILRMRHEKDFISSAEGTFLLWAASSWDGDSKALEVAKKILDQGATVNESDGEGKTPLMLLFQHARPSFPRVKMLLAEGAEVEAVDCQGRTALFYALDRRDFFAPERRKEALEVIRQLATWETVTKDTLDGSRPILEVTRAGLPEVTEVLLDILQGDTDALRPDPSGYTPLTLALMNPAFDTPKGEEMRKRLATPEAVHTKREPPLLYAPDPQSVEYLLSKGANPEFHSRTKRYPLFTHMGPLPERPERVMSEFRAGTEAALIALKKLITSNTLNAKPSNENTPLARALRHCRPQVSRLLLEEGAAIDVQLPKNSSVMHAVAANKALRTQDELQLVVDLYSKVKLGSRGRPDSREAREKTRGMGPPREARERSRTCSPREQTTGLVHGSSLRAEQIDVMTKSNRTPLSIAAQHGTPEVVRLLISLNADPGREDDRGQIPLHYAVTRPYFQTGEAWFRGSRDVSGLPALLQGAAVEGAALQCADKDCDDEGWMEQVKQRLIDYRIDTVTAEDLSVLRNFEIAIIADDSESMLEKGDGGQTRWQELREYLAVILEVAAVVDESGVDVHFLTRQEAVRGVSSVSNTGLRSILERGPQKGFTGKAALSKRFQDVAGSGDVSRPILVILFFDKKIDNEMSDFKRAVTAITQKCHGQRVMRVHMIGCSSGHQTHLAAESLRWFLPVTFDEDVRGQRSSREVVSVREQVAQTMLAPVSIQIADEARVYLGRWLWFGGEFTIREGLCGTVTLSRSGRDIVLRHPTELDLPQAQADFKARFVAVFPDNRAIWVMLDGEDRLQMRMKTDCFSHEDGMYAEAVRSNAPEQGLAALWQLMTPRGLNSPVSQHIPKREAAQLVNHTRNDGSSALHLAAKSSSLVTVQLLLAKGADSSLTRGDGMTPLQVARSEKRHDMVELLAPLTKEEIGRITDDSDELRALAVQNPQLVWSDRMQARVGQEGYIVGEVSDNTIRLQFEDGELLVFPKDAVQTEKPNATEKHYAGRGERSYTTFGR